jgi:hypothetical protein
MAGSGRYVLIDADQLRAFHPRYQEALAKDDTTAANLVHPDAGVWANRLIRDAVAARYHLIIDQTSRDPAALKAMADGLRQAGYQTDLRVMATRGEVSWQRVRTRYQEQKGSHGHGRFSTRDKHDEACAGIAATVEAVERGKCVGALGIHDQDHRPLHRAELRDGEWMPGPGAAQAFLAERERPMRPDETRALVDQYDRLAVKVREQGGTHGEMEAIAQLRATSLQLDQASHLRFADPRQATQN